MAVWALIGFVLGCAGGHAIEHTAASWQSLRFCTLAMIAMLPLFAKSAGPAPKIMLVVACCLWGAIHRPAPVDVAGAEIVFRHGTGFGAMIVAANDNRIGLAYGRAQEGDQVSLSCSSAATLLGRHRCFVRARAAELKGWRANLDQYLDQRGMTVSRWISATVFGDTSRLDFRSRTTFKNTGLYHLLVVSGFHVSLLAQVVTFVFLAPFWVLYCAQLMTPKTWSRVVLAVGVVGVIFVWFFAWFTGLGCPAQRAAICYTLTTLSLRGRKLLWAATIQGVVFPCGWLSEGNLMSWICYLVLLSLSGRRLPGFICQIALLTGTAWVVLGVFAPVGLVSNLLLSPWIACLIVGGLLILVVPADCWYTEVYTHLVIATESLLQDLSAVGRYQMQGFHGSQWLGLIAVVSFVAIRANSCKLEQKLLS